MFPLFSIFSDWSLLILRLVFAAIVIRHGWPKIRDLSARGGPPPSPDYGRAGASGGKINAGNFSAMGFKPGSFLSTIVAFVEFFGGLALVLGIYVQVVAIFFAAGFITATVWRIKQCHQFFGGFEFDLLLAAVALSFATLGGGAFSADHYLFLGGF
jgi:putative oxidoreductase